MIDSEPTEPFEDFPLRSQTDSAPRDSREAAVLEASSARAGAAPLGPRLSAAAADAAVVLLLAALALLGARLLTGVTPRPAGVPWTLAFVLYLSFFATVPPLVVFGRTIGMAISDLSARTGGESGIPARAAARRWCGTLVAAATGGLVLLWSRRDPERPTPADRLSGLPLSLD